MDTLFLISRLRDMPFIPVHCLLALIKYNLRHWILPWIQNTVCRKNAFFPF